MEVELPPSPASPIATPPPPDEAAPSIAVDPDTAIDGDLACIRCQYNLRGLRGDGRCPECGLAVLSTLRRNVVLSQTDLGWLETLRRGAYLLAASMIVWAVGPFVMVQTQVLRGHVLAPLVLVGPRAWALPFAYGMRVGGPVELILLPGLAALVLYAVGIWHVAAQEPALRETERGLAPRRLLVALAALVPLAAWGWWHFVYGSSRSGSMVWAGAFAILDCVVHVLLFMHLRHLGSRVLDAALLRETRFLGAAQTTALLVIAAGCLLYSVDRDFEGLILIGCVGLSLAGIGAAALMFAFVRAFGQSAAAARAGDETPYTSVAAAGQSGSRE